MPDLQFAPGQCWISDTELELGLGIVTGMSGRTLTLQFSASDTLRTYATDNAPLTRVRFQTGDKIESRHGWKITIQSVTESDTLLTYHGICDDATTASIQEASLNPFMSFNRPQARLFAGQLDMNEWYELRRETLTHRQRLEQSDLIGLGGARTELLPHQLYIAHEAGRRLAPRVLLADEVGLGKTIEACLILHTQLLTGRSQRALIVVPNPLLHQWLVELLRRFNLNFSLFDEERCQAIESSEQSENPFQAEQLVLCGLDLLINDEKRLTQVEAGEWDLLIVDEAHHLEWHDEDPSPAYLAVERLAKKTPGVLLLTATPEQLGSEGHFARLRLLDPDRFHSLSQFQQEQSQYQPIANAAAHLINDQPLSSEDHDLLLKTLGHELAAPLLEQLTSVDNVADQQHAARTQLTNLLLDRHGTGRGMFRNTRDRVKGFTPRVLHRYPIPLPDTYRDLTGHAAEQLQPELLAPGTMGSEWWRIDPRVDWLINLLKQHRQEKILLICAQPTTARDLEQALRLREGISAALFHEGMSIIERDRAAAWFADRDQGCPILICSEIGSEGRNFQFAHHLVLFDLPENPDLLEQRIGRLDRIGQKAQVELHTPYFEGTAQEVLLRWYHEGLNAFVHTCQSGQQILEQIKPALHQAFEDCYSDPASLNLLLTTTRQLHEQVTLALKQGRDHLLELNSCRKQEASKLVQQLTENDTASSLADYMEQLFNTFGVESEPHSKDSLVIRPGQHMLTEHFPHLPDEGITATFDRLTALTHEEWQFLSWEHPMVLDSIDMVLESGHGNATATGIRHQAIPPSSMALELLFILECPAPKLLQAGRFLPPTLLRILVDQNLQDRSNDIDISTEQATLNPLPKTVVQKIVTPLRQRIQAMIVLGEQLADKQARTILQEAIKMMHTRYSEEQSRLEALRKINPHVRQFDIDQLQSIEESLRRHLDSSRVRLDSIRLAIGI
jgi:ATP-dependent helicase HepA